MLRRLMMAGGAPVPLTTWDPARLSPLGMLSSGNLVLGASGADEYVNCRSVGAVGGMVYFSVECSKGGSNNWGVGLMDASVAAGNSDWVGSGNSAGIWYEGRVYQSGAPLHYAGSEYPSNSDVQIAVRAVSRRYWIRVNGGSWVGGGNPATDTTPTGTLPGTGAIYIAGSIDPSGVPDGLITLPAVSSEVTGPTPAGFVVGVP